MSEEQVPNALKAMVYLSRGEETNSLGECVIAMPERSIDYEDFAQEVMDETVKKMDMRAIRNKTYPAVLIELFPVRVGDPKALRSMRGISYRECVNVPYLLWVDDKEGVDTRHG